MSLLDQSQQWFPTSVQVTVHQARNLRVKGKDGTNDAYAIIQVAKDKFSTSVAEKCVAPVWKEEAAFDLPLFHPGNAERCTLYIIVMHRAQVGLDKFLGQAVINLLELHDNKSRKKTEWFRLVDKSGKEDKVRGEVLLDIQFMRNNMSASMFDLSMQDKPRSRISKIKDKVRGKKKKDGFSDSVSAIVPSVSQVLTDSEEEADAQSLNHAPGAKKKSKLKNLFAPKTNLQRNISQSMSTLGTLPEKNSSLSGSRSSGINADSPEVKKKFKFLGHKRTGSSDSKVSLGAFSLLGRSKQSNSDLNNLCINGSHVYTEQADSKNGSTLSLNSSGQGSMEDVRKQTSDADPIKGVPVTCYRPESTDQLSLEQQRHQEEERRRQAEEKHIAEARRLEEEERYKAEAKRLQEEEQRKQQEEQERRRRFVEDEARKEKQQQQQKEEERRRQDEELRMQEAAENQRLEEERRRAEEQKRQEEASMSERLSSLFGMIRKKDEKKEEVQQHAREEQLPSPVSESRGPDQPAAHHSTNPFEDVSLSSDPPPVSSESPADNQKFSPFNPQTPSAGFFLNRTAKVSAVKPRLAQTLESEPGECQTPCQPFPSPAKSESTLSSVPSESTDTFSNLHSSLAPPKISRTLSGSSCGSTENLSSVGSGESSPTMANQKRRAPLPPSYPEPETPTGGNQIPVGELRNPADGTQQGNKLSIPLPDYETLFPFKRHGVQAHSRWDHIIAEVNQRHRDSETEPLGPEMSVDGPDERELSPGSSVSQENPPMRKEETKLVSSKKVAAPPPPKPVASAAPQSVAGSSQKQSQNIAPHSLMRPNQSVISSVKTDHSSSSHRNMKVLHPASASTATSQIAFDTAPLDDQRTVPGTSNKEAPTAKPRQRFSGKEQAQRDESAVNGTVQTLSNVNGVEKTVNENFGELGPFRSSKVLSSSPWEQLKQNQEVKSIFAGNVQENQRPEDDGMTTDDLDKIFNQEKVTDLFASLNGSDSNKQSGSNEKDDSEEFSPAFLRRNSQRGKKILPSTVASDNKMFMSQQEPVYKEGISLFTANPVVTNAPVAPQPQADVKTQNSFQAGEDPFGVDPFRVASTLTSVEPLPVVMEEPASHTENLSAGKTLLRAWVSPSEGQPVSSQNSNGGGLASTPRRPHPVKPMSATESPHPTNTPAVKEIKVRDSTSGMTKHVDSVASGPYSQLTQEELITLVVKQQADLSRKDSKIVELEDYIDNLLVRVIDEKPTILQSLTFAKPV